MRVIAIDFGGKRIGVAAGDTDAKVASPRQNIDASGTLAKDARAVKAAAERDKATTVVVGVPLDADGETKMSCVCRRLGQEIESLGFDVEYIDEAHTSTEAERDMAEARLKGSERRRRSDAEAACRILERYFEKSK